MCQRENVIEENVEEGSIDPALAMVYAGLHTQFADELLPPWLMELAGHAVQLLLPLSAL